MNQGPYQQGPPGPPQQPDPYQPPPPGQPPPGQPPPGQPPPGQPPPGQPPPGQPPPGPGPQQAPPGQYPPGPYPQPYPGPPLRGPGSAEERNWAMGAHLSGLVGGFLGPLVVWLIKKDTLPMVDAHGKEALNFHLSMLLYIVGYFAASAVLMLVLIGFALFFLGVFLVMGLYVFQIVVMIQAAIKANQGEFYSYPLTIRFIK